MKFTAIILGLMFSLSSFATDFFAKIDNTDCKISGSSVVRTQYIGKEKKLGFTEKNTVSMFGTEDFIAKAVETSSDVPASQDADYVFSMIKDGKTYYLSVNDSKETMLLIRFIAQICR